ncbi:MAG TPA: four helix bundle protein [Vicinamibacterales bacterium]|nr:four helix bundle protein [Vicinamibacterales bacterium]
MVGSFRDLSVWQNAMQLVERIYDRSERFPRSEVYGLTSQMRRAAISIPSNIAEGKAVGGQCYPRHLKIALGSKSELETQIELARRLKLLNEGEAQQLLDETAVVGRQLATLLKSLPRY